MSDSQSQSKRIYRQVPCPRCGANRGETCVSSYGTPTKNTHASRVDKYIDAVNRRARAIVWSRRHA